MSVTITDLGRIRFIAAGATEVGPNERPPFGCVLLIWEGGKSRKPSMAGFWASKAQRADYLMQRRLGIDADA